VSGRGGPSTTVNRIHDRDAALLQASQAHWMRWSPSAYPGPYASPSL